MQFDQRGGGAQILINKHGKESEQTIMIQYLS